jgi:NifU-like protein involved in Fe-S cluster formation|tara:strand:- start:39197 stop:39649 length:453 start_codon:yes stop_codon:yes gene_type:complete
MSEQLYNTRILRLAAAIPLDERLETPQASVRKVSPICGSRVTADVTLDAAGQVSQFGQEVRACALGQASASLLGSRVMGLNAAELRAAADALRGFLAEGTPLPHPLTELEIFGPAQPHKARHPSILLAWEAAAEAAAAAQAESELSAPVA